MKRNVVFADNRQIVFTTDMEMPDGKVAKDFLCCDFGASVSVLSVCPEVGDRGVLAIMQKSYKPAAGKWFITCQAGGINKRRVDDEFVYTESPEQAAEREVQEEAGVKVSHLISLGETYLYASKLIAPEYLFLALIDPPPAVLVGDTAEGTQPFVIGWRKLLQMMEETPEDFLPQTVTVIQRARSRVDTYL